MITSAKKLINPYTNEYSALEVVKDGITMSVPLNLANTDYAEVMEKVDAGELTIQEADSE